jgi:hypothetical protein
MWLPKFPQNLDPRMYIPAPNKFVPKRISVPESFLSPFGIFPKSRLDPGNQASLAPPRTFPESCRLDLVLPIPDLVCYARTSSEKDIPGPYARSTTYFLCFFWVSRGARSPGAGQPRASAEPVADLAGAAATSSLPPLPV